MIDNGSEERAAYCMEAGVRFNTSSHAYTGLDNEGSSYWTRLPRTAQKGIMLASLYGWQPGKAVPVSGANEDDYIIATNTLIWEYQQQLRTSPSDLAANAWGIPGATYYNNIAGRPAQRCYDWMLSQMKNHSTVPSFTSEKASDVKTHTLKWDKTNHVYTLTLVDTNNTYSDIQLGNNHGITVTRNGNVYTFSTKSMIQDPITITCQKNVPGNSSDMLVWERDTYQALVTGAKDPVTFYMKLDTESTGSVRVVKESEDGQISGIRFRLTGISLLGEAVDLQAVTDDAGIAIFENVPVSGSTPYILEEVETAARYVVPAGQEVTVTYHTATEATVENILKKFCLTVKKKDAKTGTVQGDGSLAGAVYGLYQGGNLVDRFTTDEEGGFTTGYYVCGEDWTLRELVPSEGYLLDETVYHVGAEAKNHTIEKNKLEQEVKEQAVKGSIAIIKHTDDGSTGIETPETGAAFQIYRKAAGSYEQARETERDTIVCDENGFARTKALPYGVYTVHQTDGWPHCERIEDFDVAIRTDGETYRYLINNARFESYLKVVKTDEETGKSIPCAGAGFQIYDPLGNRITMTYTYPQITEVDTFYTTEEGYLITPQPLAAGEGYSLVEVQAPAGYVRNEAPVFFDVKAGEAGEEAGIPIITVKRSNVAQKGTISVKKSGEIFASVTEVDGKYRPVYAEGGLAGAVYEIIAAEEIKTADGTTRAEKGQVVDTVTTGVDGRAVSRELYLGAYEIREITAPEGMVLDQEGHPVCLTYAGQEVVVTNTELYFHDERQKVEIDLKKSLAVDKAYGIGEKGELWEVTFGLYAAAPVNAADGTEIPAEGLVEIISLDEAGCGKVSTDLPFGAYSIKEL